MTQQAAPVDAAGRGYNYGRLCYNENPVGVSPRALKAMREAEEYANRYPDWFSDTLENEIADHLDLPANTICAGAGATEIIRLVADAFLGPGDEMITASPTYFQMGSEAIQNGASIINVPVDENYVIDLNLMCEAVTAETKLISLVNPNNPQGAIVNKFDLKDFIHSLPNSIVVVVDEAYHHYVESPHYESCIGFIRDELPVIVIRTFSKAYGLAGARIGYAVAPRQLISQIASSQIFGTISNISQAAAIEALKDDDHLEKTLRINRYAKVILEKGFIDLGLDYIHSETNFMMFDTGMNAGAVVAQLSARRFRVRWGWGMPQHIRVSTGLPDETADFIAALGEILSTIDPMKTKSGLGINAVSCLDTGSGTTIRFSTCSDDKTSLTVFNSSGTKIKILVHESLEPGLHERIWDGCDASGRLVDSGDYVILLIQGEHAVSRRMKRNDQNS